MVKTNNNDITKAFTGGKSVKAIYTHRQKVWPPVQIPEGYVIIPLYDDDSFGTSHIPVDVVGTGGVVSADYYRPSSSSDYKWFYSLQDDKTWEMNLYTIGAYDANFWQIPGSPLCYVANKIGYGDSYVVTDGSKEPSLIAGTSDMRPEYMWKHKNKLYHNNTLLNYVSYKPSPSHSNLSLTPITWYDGYGNILDIDGRLVWNDPATNQTYYSDGNGNDYILADEERHIWNIADFTFSENQWNLNWNRTQDINSYIISHQKYVLNFNNHETEVSTCPCWILYDDIWVPVKFLYNGELYDFKGLGPYHGFHFGEDNTYYFRWSYDGIGIVRMGTPDFTYINN